MLPTEKMDDEPGIATAEEPTMEIDAAERNQDNPPMDEEEFVGMEIADDSPYLPQGQERSYLLVVVPRYFASDLAVFLQTTESTVDDVESIVRRYDDFVRRQQLPIDQNHFDRFAEAMRFARSFPQNSAFQFLDEGDLNGILGGGLTDAEMSAIPQETIDVTMTEAQPSCSICIVDYEMDEMVSQLICGHRFHPECIRQWLQSHRSCPFCRTLVQ